MTASDVTTVTGNEARDRPLCYAEKLILGAIGGAVVTIMLYPLDAYEVMAKTDPTEAVLLGIGWFIRLLFFMFLGGLWAHIYQSERDRLKVFQLGLIAPLVIQGFVAAHLPTNGSDDSTMDGTAFNFAIISSAHASTRLDLPIEGVAERSTVRTILDGFLGTERPKPKPRPSGD